MLISSVKRSAINFYEYFISVEFNLAAYISPITSNFKNYMPSRASHSFYMLPTNNDEILGICANFESKDRTGYDETFSATAKSIMQC